MDTVISFAPEATNQHMHSEELQQLDRELLEMIAGGEAVVNGY